MCDVPGVAGCAVRFIQDKYPKNIEGTMMRANDRDVLAKEYIRHVLKHDGECCVCGGEDE